MKGVGVASAADWASVAVTLVLGVAGFRLALSVRKETQLRVAERRQLAYERLWALMESASPSAEPLNEAERRLLEEKLADWYYRSADGMLLMDVSRMMYHVVRRNLICPLDDLEPKESRQRLQQLTDGELERQRGLLAQRQLSLMRNQMIFDLQFFGKATRQVLDQEDTAFLEYCGITTSRKRGKVP